MVTVNLHEAYKTKIEFVLLYILLSHWGPLPQAFEEGQSDTKTLIKYSTLPVTVVPQWFVLQTTISYTAMVQSHGKSTSKKVAWCSNTAYLWKLHDPLKHDLESSHII